MTEQQQQSGGNGLLEDEIEAAVGNALGNLADITANASTPLRERLKAAATAPAPVKPASPPPPALRRSADDELVRFLDTAERMLKTVRDQMASAESAFVIEAAKLADSYRRRITALEQEGADALRQLEADHRESMVKRQHMLTRLIAMRGE